MIPSKNDSLKSENICQFLKPKSKTDKKADFSSWRVKEKILQTRQSYSVNYRKKRIGRIRESLNGWIATASFQYGGCERKFFSKRKAKGWLLNNYLKVVKAQIQFSVSENLCHYTIESGYWLIKIDVRQEDCISTIQDGNDLLFEYFPSLNDAIAMGFDLILNSDSTIDNSQNEEF